MKEVPTVHDGLNALWLSSARDWARSINTRTLGPRTQAKVSCQRYSHRHECKKPALQRWPTPLLGPAQSSFTLAVWMVVRTAVALTVVAGGGATTLGLVTIIQTSIASALLQGGTRTMDAVSASAATAASAVGSLNGLAGFPSSDGVKALHFDANSGYEVPTAPAEAPGKTIYDHVTNNFDNHAKSAMAVRTLSQVLYGTSLSLRRNPTSFAMAK